MAINITTLFTELGKGLYAQEVINTARGTTVPPEVKDFIDQFNSKSLDFKRAIDSATSADKRFKSGAAQAMASLREAMRQVIIETVEADEPQPRKNLTAALEELVRQMSEQSESVDASAPGISVAADAGNQGDGVLLASIIRGDGLNQENALAETIRAEVSSSTSITARGEAVEADRLSSDWPKGSGVTASVPITDASNSLIANGDFDDEDDQTNVPDEWIPSVATVGTTLKMTDNEVQRIVVAGSPTSGTYRISWQNQSSKTQVTEPLAYNADGGTVQAALNKLTGLELVTVSTSGTSPNYTHDITFTGVAGNLNEVTIVDDQTDTGTITPSTVTAGSTYALKGKAVEFDSDGAELTTLNAKVSLEPLTVYVFNAFFVTDSAPAAGVLTVDLVDGIGGSVIADEQGTNNSFTIDATALTTSWVAQNGFFRTPKDLPALTYLRIRISTAVSGTSSIFFDLASLVKATELYPGGPFAAAFNGATAFSPGTAQVTADGWDITVTNDRAGEFQEWFDRNFDMRSKRLLLPSDSGGSETQADTLIA